MSKTKTKHHMPGRTYQLGALGLGIVLLVALASISSRGGEAEIENELSSKLSPPISEKSSISNSEKVSSPEKSDSSSTSKSPVVISLDEAAGIPYYHCEGGGSDDEVVSLVLLHGARFTKEDWKSPSGILEDFCSRNTKRKLNVFALDLPVSADFQQLADVLEAMAKGSKMEKPVSLVTPSASGKTMVTWAASLGNSQGNLPEYVKQWIPVAAVAVNRAPEDDIQKLKGLPILAIYGDKDPPGKHSSGLLQNFANARVVELVGSHPCYLDSPKEFVDEVIHFIDSSGS